ncbi:Piso0_000102 [Millerozyma farinosa CBS 7064]|uniref:Piso0_000102 protein n=1 Tax=Pichia sorbitophila (strain ATCC MYA-4447 / BCRC 22081 / CBS 7064 / NBRC 10061 / NRRL Y-12695) TaxID=559304 RepID=G8YUI9_PICSO|nr:Piso0_000102 [Millerozyma farinosa CBS 7064]
MCYHQGVNSVENSMSWKDILISSKTRVPDSLAKSIFISCGHHYYMREIHVKIKTAFSFIFT